MGRHHGIQFVLCDKLLKWLNISGKNNLFGSFVIWCFQMRIGKYMAMAREMLTCSSHSRRMHAVDKGRSQLYGWFRFTMKTAITNGFAIMPEIQHRGETQIYIQGHHFGCHQPTRLLCDSLLFVWVGNQSGKSLHCR